MSLGVLFWILMIFALLFSVWWYWPGRAAIAGPYGMFNGLLPWVLFAILGWQVFGAAVK